MLTSVFLCVIFTNIKKDIFERKFTSLICLLLLINVYNDKLYANQRERVSIFDRLQYIPKFYFLNK